MGAKAATQLAIAWFGIAVTTPAQATASLPEASLNVIQRGVSLKSAGVTGRRWPVERFVATHAQHRDAGSVTRRLPASGGERHD
jgi:hypothetical protein